MDACAWSGGQVLGSKDSFRAGDPGATALNTKAALDIGTQRVGRRVVVDSMDYRHRTVFLPFVLGEN